jgi:hypothetical protein
MAVPPRPTGSAQIFSEDLAGTAPWQGLLAEPGAFRALVCGDHVLNPIDDVPLALVARAPAITGMLSMRAEQIW